MLLSSNPTAPPPEAPLGWRDRALKFAYTGRRKVATVAAGFLVLVVAYHVVFGANGLTAYEAKRHETVELAKQIEALKAENAKLAIHNDRLQHDRGAIEESIRTHLHYAKPDEVILTVPAAPAPVIASTPAK